MKHRIALLTALLLITAAVPALAQYHWRHSALPFNLDVGDNVTTDWDATLAASTSDWSAAATVDLSVVSGSAGRNCDATPGQVEVCTRKFGSTGWLSLTSLSLSGSHITAATIKLNTTYLSSPNQMILCNELGHSLGVSGGNGAAASCMDLSGSNPSAADLAALDALNNHIDALAPLDQPPAMHLIRIDGPGQWGELVAESDNGDASLYVLDFGNGHRIVTRVLWAPEETPFDVE